MATRKRNISSKNAKVRKPITDQQRLLLGSFIILFGLLCMIAFGSFFFTGDIDQSILNDFGDRQTEATNIINKFGAALSDFFVRQGVGISAFMIASLLIWTGISYYFEEIYFQTQKSVVLEYLSHPFVFSVFLH